MVKHTQTILQQEPMNLKSESTTGFLVFIGRFTPDLKSLLSFR